MSKNSIEYVIIFRDFSNIYYLNSSPKFYHIEISDVHYEKKSKRNFYFFDPIHIWEARAFIYNLIIFLYSKISIN